MEAGCYTETRSHHDVKCFDQTTEALLLNTFVGPLPFVGTTLVGLAGYPLVSDRVASRDTDYPLHYTAWNFHKRGVLTQTVDTPTILCDGALEQVLRIDNCASAID